MKWIVGIDEVGRGPIAGPVAVCACAVRAKDYAKMKKWSVLTDSKKMTSVNREVWYNKARVLKKDGMIDFAVVYRSSNFIDTHGIAPAIRACIKAALKQLDLDPSECTVLLDGSLKAPVEYMNQTTIIKGDLKEKIISLASVIAKVSRDAYMIKQHKKYAIYGWNKNKGYGTREHYGAIAAKGTTALHRKSFLTKLK